MNSINDLQQNFLLKSCLLGIVRGLVVHTFIYPLETIKTHQQCQNQGKINQIAKQIWQQEGFKGFYRGLLPQLINTSIKQAWCWPLMIGIPDFLDRYHLSMIQKQALTGLTIATANTVLTPLEKARISAIYSQKKFNLANLSKKDWQGFSSNWAKLSVDWSVFLVSQQYFRDREQSGQEALTLTQLTKIGIKVAFIASLATAPFDVANTLKQSQNIKASSLFSGNIISNLYRGWPINVTKLMIHNIASVILIDRLSLNKKGQ